MGYMRTCQGRGEEGMGERREWKGRKGRKGGEERGRGGDGECVAPCLDKHWFVTCHSTTPALQAVYAKMQRAALGSRCLSKCLSS